MKLVLLLGSNVDKELNLPRCQKHLEHDPDIVVSDHSWTYESNAVGSRAAPRFHNRALLVDTPLTEQVLRERTKALETKLGRVREADLNAPRPIDIDIVAFVNEGKLRVLDDAVLNSHHAALPVAELVGHLRLEDGRPLREHLVALGESPEGLYRVGIRPIPPPPKVFEVAEELEIALEGEWVETLGKYLQLLLSTNERFNLTAVKDANEAWLRHILDSLSLVHPIDFIEAERIADVGSGGGLPGIPLAIAFPDIEVTLIEATGKKADFLAAVARDLHLDNVRVIHGRAEDVGHADDHRGSYDAVIARGVGPLRVLLELTAPLARVGGGLLAMKGAKAEEEIAEANKALKLLRCRVVGEEPTPMGTIVIIEKEDTTPATFPRRAGEPKRAPLGSAAASSTLLDIKKRSHRASNKQGRSGKKRTGRDHRRQPRSASE